MFDITQLLFFCGAALALLLVPGPAVLYIVARSVSQGRKAGLVSVLGIETASFCHATAAALGLSAILMTSALAFSVVKYVGAAYLIYLGIRKLLERDSVVEDERLLPQSLPRTYVQGVVVNLLNPKTALFFFSFLPQFVDTGKGSATLQILFLGLLFIGMATVTDGSYALLSSTIAGKLKNGPSSRRRRKHLAGMVYIALGIFTALTGSHRK
jgi:threonine/homoserine/homoserine lactone efflux protein